ncbi:unnamed protein product [Ambrosiozyma monospora]|uniref:Unnamed protein product n=1 Tax=Ambrosiozyma monospora TaxID=43982 RepID=A0ACB5T0T8_AMBMO|nr:unnamed protein product [Ambrosiozyma monospora]
MIHFPIVNEESQFRKENNIQEIVQTELKDGCHSISPIIQTLSICDFQVCETHSPNQQWFDPVFAVGIGCASYYVYEKREGRQDGHQLHELVLKKFEEWKSGEKKIYK